MARVSQPGANSSASLAAVPTTSSSEAAESPGALTAGHGFGTAPVFLASISTILGAILFLRFGYGVAHAGVLGALAIVLLGHLVTVPTALAIAEIATNRRVEGGGEYFIISRSVGTTIGGSIGIALFLSRAISVAFYMIAFAESFSSLAPWFERVAGIPFDPRLVSVPATIALVVLVLLRGANVGVKALWLVTAVLGLSLAMFFLGSAPEGAPSATMGLLEQVPNHDRFMLVFAILFPAFTGMAAGVGLSGDLKNPRRSIPLGTVAATATGMVVYILFFMVTYGALCAISFLEYLAARPSYRPSFRSKWYLSLLGALMSLFLMFQMAYILFGHPDWDEAEIRIFAAFPREEVEEQRARLLDLIATGRLAISEKNLRVIATDDRTNFERLVEAVSSNADLVIFGFTAQRFGEKGAELFRRHPSLRDVLFVSAEQRVRIE